MEDLPETNGTLNASQIGEELARLAALVMGLDDAVIGTTLEGAIVSWNAGAERIYGFPAEKIKGENFVACVPPDLREEWAAVLQKIGAGEPVEAFKTRRITRDGAVVHLSTGISAVKDSAGNITGASIITKDITQARQAEEALVLERNLVRAVLENVTEHVYVKDAAGRYLLDNPAHREFLGVSVSVDVIGKTVFDFFPASIAEQYHADDIEIMRSGEALMHREEPSVSRAGNKRLLSTSKIPFHNAKGEVAGLVCISRDITGGEGPA